MGSVLTNDVPDILDFDCPRCHLPTSNRHYGPCDNCIATLKATQTLNKQAVVVEDYVPKMNVTPNAVATKD